MVSQVWLITGTSSGFGAALVNELIRRGDKVIATARNVAKISTLKEAGAAVIQLDVTAPPDELEKKAQEALAIYGGLDVLVNNAGYSYFGTFEDASHQDWLAQFNSNLFGAINVTRSFLPHFRTKKAGTLVFIGSAAAWVGLPTLSLYAASKHALTGAAESVAQEVKPLGIRTMIVQPGFFRTALLHPNNSTFAETAFDDYKPLVAPLYEQYRGAHGKQTGDPEKGASCIVDVVKGEGLAEGKEPPATLVLGSDCVAVVRQKCEETLNSLKEWEELSSSTDV
ncbi:hypothetical protein SLS56_011818 [Neofusicoccum ribis]|uniref:Oxidoreductase n=1 Tax=Neofusicoccum ribis TaxID=45134 RepID=A0ABR3SBJ9_9PEZI